MQKRVVVTGVGIVSPIGIGKAAFWNGLKEGRSGINRITQFDVTNFPVKFAGEVTDFDPLKFMTSKHARRLFRFSQFGLAAAKMAFAESRLDLNKEDRERIGVSVGTSIGALVYGDNLSEYQNKGIDAIHPFFASYVIPSSCATEISLGFKISGPVYTNVNACAASTSAIGLAYHLIRGGQAEVMVAGGAEASISPITLGSLWSSRILSHEATSREKAYQPFSIERTGIVIGDGAAMIILEDLEHAYKRNAPILAEIVGYATNCDGFHILFQPPEGERAALAIQLALKDAHLKPEEVDYINAHGSGTLMNDKTETLVIKKVFGERAYKIPISTTKPAIGHAMGACGALELAACIAMLEQQFLHPTVNYGVPDPKCDLDYIPNHVRYQKVDTILKLSFGFGGYNAACILKRFDQQSSSR